MRCLLDVNVLIDLVRSGQLAVIAARKELGVSSLVLCGAEYWRDEDGGVHAIDPLEVTAAGVEVFSATLEEMAVILEYEAVGRLACCEQEMLALVRSRGIRYCTEDQVFMRVGESVGAGSLLVALAVLRDASATGQKA